MRGKAVDWWLSAMVVIFVIDWALGPVAEHLNAYEIARRTFAPNVFPQVASQYLFQQERWGDAVLLVGWVAWSIEAALTVGLLRLGMLAGGSE